MWLGNDPIGNAAGVLLLVSLSTVQSCRLAPV
jgi:hypothetical protein